LLEKEDDSSEEKVDDEGKNEHEEYLPKITEDALKTATCPNF